MGSLVAVAIHEGNIQDRAGVPQLLKAVPKERNQLRHLWADQGYTGGGVKAIRRHGWTVEITRHNADRSHGAWRTAQMPLFKAVRGFQLMRRRWVVERTFAWLGRYRRLSKDYEQTVLSSKTWLWVATVRMLAQRLAFA